MLPQVFYNGNNCLWFLETPHSVVKARKIIKHFPSVDSIAKWHEAPAYCHCNAS